VLTASPPQQRDTIIPVLAIPGQADQSPSPSPSPSPSTSPPPNFAEDPLGYVLTLPLRILAVVLVALALVAISNLLVKRVVRRLTAKLDSDSSEGSLQPQSKLRMPGNNARRAQRIAAVGSLLKSLFAAIITAVAILTILPMLGIDIGPLLVSASVLGVALGFGAQNLIKDYLAGVFIVMEDQYGLGDVIETNGLVGTVEDVGLRVTQIRDLTGVVWYLRNGELLQVGNRSQGWTLATADIPIDPDADLAVVRDVVNQTGQAMLAEDSNASGLLEAPFYAGVESVSSLATVVRIASKAAPDKQIVASRQLRERMRAALQQHGIHIATQPMVIPTTPPAPPTAPPQR
jgi:moderate conductance mechanosensitive channel